MSFFYLLIICVALQIRLYQVLTADAVSSGSSRSVSDSSVRLLDRKTISSHARPGWEVFKVTDVVRHWINDSSVNHGIPLNFYCRSEVGVQKTLLPRVPQ